MLVRSVRFQEGGPGTPLHWRLTSFHGKTQQSALNTTSLIQVKGLLSARRALALGKQSNLPPPLPRLYCYNCELEGHA
eukprot:1157562-Pelagomonas_calceolata.AAC.3